MKRFIKLAMNNIFYIRFLISLIIIFFNFFLLLANSQDIKFREGIIKYISKPTIISKPFILISTNERFYITNELYQNLIQNIIQNSYNNYDNEKSKFNINKYWYFKIVDNLIYEIQEKPFKDYIYEFPKIFRTKIFEFNDYNILYVLFYYNLSEFVNIEAKTQDNKNLFIYFTSPNSISIKLPKKQKIQYIKLYLNYNNPYFKNLNFKKEYIINL
ncbi:MAG: hypothetical protein ACP5O4_07270 [bacterium]